MKIPAGALLDELVQLTRQNIERVENFQNLDPSLLNHRKEPGKWSALECIKHLNLYGDYYLPEIENQINKSNARPPSGIFKTGILGNYFANLMKVKNGKIVRMQSPKNKNPIHSELNPDVLNRFLKHQDWLLNLLEKAKQVDLTKTTTGISISQWIRLRLGDTFRVVIYHNDRHIRQAQRALEN